MAVRDHLAVHAAQSGSRSLELADEAWARFDLDAVIAHTSAAVRGFTAEGSPRDAAMACVRLGEVITNALGNLTAGRAWFARAARLVADEEPCVEQGWVAIAAMGCDVGDPERLLACAQLALERARQFGDLDLETKALADGGLAHVQAGRLDEGFAMLDEAMALACGPAAGDAAAKSVCSFFTACYYTSEFERAGDWTDLLRQHGLIGPAPGGPVFLGNHCASLQGAMLCELGRWTEAEKVLTSSSEQFEAAMGSPAFHSTIVLALLRIRQGRLTDAEELLAGKEQAFEALLPGARLHLARGDHQLARACARRGLRALADDRPRAVELCEVLVDAELAAGDLPGAQDVLADLRTRAAPLGDIPSVVARVATAAARVLVGAGDPEAAIAELEAALDRLDATRAPWRRALLQIELVRVRAATGDLVAARLDARGAAASVAELDVVLPARDAALLCELSGSEAGAGEEVRVATITSTGSTWRATFGGEGVQLRDSKGMRYLAELIASPGVERHALDLVDRIEGVDPGGALDRRRLGDAGPSLDATARGQYRRRLEELRADIDDALEGGRLETAEELQGEHDQLVAQLAAAFGIGGRARAVGSAAERARLNVTRSLRTAIIRLTEALPEAGAALDRGVRTGTYCVYEPDPADISWIVQSGLNDPPRS
jgi:tetratricopeptide (TPR) repeat protein